MSATVFTSPFANVLYVGQFAAGDENPPRRLFVKKESAPGRGLGSDAERDGSRARANGEIDRLLRADSSDP